MENVFSVAYATKDDDGNCDLYVDTCIASTGEEAIGWSMLNGLGAEIQGKGEMITGVNVSSAEREDVDRMVIGRLGSGATVDKLSHLIDAVNGVLDVGIISDTDQETVKVKPEGMDWLSESIMALDSTD